MDGINIVNCIFKPDQHFARVFSDTTPDNRSPKLRSPTSGRRRGGPTAPPVRPRRERDLISTFSGDSGNVHDLYPSDTLPSSMTKSRSMPAEMRLHDRKPQLNFLCFQMCDDLYSTQ